MALTNFAGKMYTQFDSLLEEIDNSTTENKQAKSSSSKGLLTRNIGSSFNRSESETVDIKQEQFKIPLMAFLKIRKRRNKNNGIS